MIVGEIRRYLRDNSSLRVSRSMRDTAYRVLQAKEKFMNEHQREPSIEEIAKILELKRRFPQLLVEVDGGVNQETAPQVLEAGADVLIAGTAVFGAKNPTVL